MFQNIVPINMNMREKNYMPNLPLAIHQSRSFNVAGVHLVSTAQTSVTVFLDDLRSSMSEGNKNQGDRWPIYAKYLLSSLETLLPDGKLQPGYVSRQGLITEDEIFQTKFNQLLVFSIANNFAGLQDVPITSILKYWGRTGGMVSLLLQSLQASQSHFAKALTQNLFRAAIEANDERVLKSLLSIRSLDVNTTMCIVNGEKVTPVERAAYLQELGIVELLLIAKTDVNKKFREPANAPFYSRSLCSRGALGNFISGCRTATSEAFELAKLLLRAGAQVNGSVAEHALGYLDHRDLAYLIVSSVSDSDHAKFMGSRLLTHIALSLSDRQATEVTNKLILACQRTNCGRCLSQFQAHIDSALVQGAKRGHSELVGLLLRYSTTPHRALSAAIQCGKREMIDAILTLKPDMDAPAHSLYEPRSIFRRKWGRDEDEDGGTTSLAEAIKSRDESLIRMIEDAGSLAHLNEGGRFQAAITAASRTGNAIYVQKLLEHCSSPEPSHMTKAVLHAIRNNHEQIFRTLLAAGAEINQEKDFYENLNLLHTAMVCRNSYMVRELLNADIKLSSRIEMDVFEEAIKWGDKSIIEDLQSTFPGTQVHGNELSEALEKGHMEWFEFLLSSRIFTGDALTDCLMVSVGRGDERLFHDLIKRGANPTSDYILQHCAESRPKMLPLLLEQHPSRSSDCAVPDFGTSALIAVTKQGLEGLEAVNILLGCRLVDTESYSDDGELPLVEAIRMRQNGNHDNFAVIRKLLDRGCDPNCIATKFGHRRGINETAFLVAIETKSKTLVQLMIDHGADVNRKATMGLKRTPLQTAVEVNSFELVALLLGANADANDKPATRGGGTALQLAAIQGNCNIAAKLLECGADLSAPPAVVNGRWPLEGAAEHGRLDMIEFLWKNKLSGFGIAGFDEKQCRRAMELAEGNGHNPCRDLIAELSQASVSANVLDVEWPGSPLGFA
jgi:ankyrin repeat protein